MADLTPIYNAIEISKDKTRPLPPGQFSNLLRDELAGRLAFNLLTLMPEIDFEQIPGHALDHLYIALSERGWSIGKEKAKDALIRAALEFSYHPVEQYLSHVEQDDGTDALDLDSVATDFLGTNDRLYGEMLAATLIGAVARAMDPGSKFDTCCVLRGAQGLWKSTFWKCLASPDWFSDTPQESDKDLRLLINTTWIYELAELDSVTTKKEAAQVKALLSSPVDRFRPPYGGAMETFKRRSIMVGTCNRDDFLRDDTGNRRFWVIEVRDRIDTSRLVENRDRIWRAAVLAYRAGRLPILSPTAQAESERRNQGYAPEHPWLGLLSRWMLSAPVEFTTDQALIGANCVGDNRIERRHQMEVAPLLKSLGFTRDEHQTRTDGSARPRLWRRASQPASTSSAEVETPQTQGQQSDPAPLSQPLNLSIEVLLDEEGQGPGQEKGKKRNEVEVETAPMPPKHLTKRLMELRSANPTAHPHFLASLLSAPGVNGREVKAWLPWIDECLNEFNDPIDTAA